MKGGQPVVGFANLAYQLGGDVVLLRRLAREHNVLVLVEARDRGNDPIPVGQILGPDWRTAQNLSSGEAAGSAIAVHRGGPWRMGWTRSVLASRSSRLGAGVQNRYLRAVGVRDDDGPIRLGGVHLALKETGRHDDGLDVAREWFQRGEARGVRSLLGGDFNMPPTEARRQLGAPKGGGGDVMAAVWSAKWGSALLTKTKRAGTDHHTLTWTLL